MTPAKGKSPLDKKKVSDAQRNYNGAHKNSIEGRLHRGDLLMPGMNKKESIAAYKAWQKQFRIDGASMESWYRSNVQDHQAGQQND